MHEDIANIEIKAYVSIVEACRDVFDFGQRMGYSMTFSESDNPFCHDVQLRDWWLAGFWSVRLGARQDSKINWVKEGF